MSRRDISEQNGRRTRGVSGRCLRGSGCAFRRARPRSPAPQDPGSPRPPRPPGEGDSFPEGPARRSADRWRQPPLDQRRGGGRPDHRAARRPAGAPRAAADPPARSDGHVDRSQRALVRAHIRAGLDAGRRRAARRNRARHAGPQPPASCGRSTNSRPSPTASARTELTPASICNCAWSRLNLVRPFRKHQLWAGRNAIENMKTLRKLFICLVLSLIVAAAAPAAAQGFKWWQTERFQKELALTAEQITRIEGIYQTTEPLAARAEAGARQARGQALEGDRRPEVGRGHGAAGHRSPRSGAHRD